jgi:integrase
MRWARTPERSSASRPRASLPTLERIQDPQTLVFAHQLAADTALDQGRLECASQHLDQLLTPARDSGQRPVDEAGGPRYTPHQLRHTRGSELIAQGQRVVIVQRVLGHRDVRSTLGYAELQDAQVRAALEGMALP